MAGWRNAAAGRAQWALLAPLVGLTLLLVALGFQRPQAGPAPPGERPAQRPASGTNRPGQVNIVIFLIDTLRADRLGVYGYTRRPTSPHIDALAREAVVFEQAYAPSPWTLPTVVSLLTSTFPCEHGVLHNRHRLGDGFEPLAARLKRLDYRTINLYANPFAGPRFGAACGFDALISRGRQQSDGATVAAALGEPAATPFFLYIHNTEPHNPYDYAPAHVDGFRDIPPETRRWFEQQNALYRRLTRVDFDHGRPPGTTDNTADQQRVLAELHARAADYCELYDAAVWAADQRLGSVVDALKARGVWEDTLFIILADHGEEFGEHGGWEHDQSVYEELMRVPLIVRFPRGQFGGRRIRSVASLVDVIPTLAQYLDQPALAAGARGRSLLPLISGAEPDRDRGFHIPGMRMNRKKHFRPWKEARGDTNVVIRHAMWKGIWNVEPDTLELYDLAQDPREQSSVSAQHPELAADMLRVARAWYQECGGRGAAPAATPEEELDEETRQNLRALGYID